MSAKRNSSRLDDSSTRRFWPWRPAPQVEDASLFWIPVSGFPVPEAETKWLAAFFRILGKGLEKNFSYRCEHFLQLKSIYPRLMNVFVLTAQKLLPYPGLSRRPGKAIVPPPSEQELQEMLKGTRPVPPFEDMVSDLCYWLLQPDTEQIHQHFLGCGGLTQIWLPPSPLKPPSLKPINAKIRQHPAFKDMNIEGTTRATYALADPFQAASKEMFGADLKNEPSVVGLPFIIPLLHSRDIFEAASQVRGAWLDLLPVYANESKEDKGVLLLANKEVDPVIFEVLVDMDANETFYPLQ